MSRVRLHDEILFIDVSGGSMSTDEFVDRRGSLALPVFQVAQASVSDERLFLVRAIDHLASFEEKRTIAEILQQRVGTGQVAFVLERGPGRAELEAITEAPYGPLAAAAAVVNVSWGWDESEAFEITVNATRYRVVVDHFGDATWCYSCVELHAP